jgi:thymidine kinase
MAKLYFRYGTMNSSKSAQLLMVHHNYTEQGKTAVIFKPLLDTRDGSVVKSRALDTSVPAILVGITRVGTMFDYTEKNRPACVLVDEVQFMSIPQIDELAKIVDLLNIPVIAYGLMTDFQTNSFSGSRRLIEIGARVEEIKTVCWSCSRKAVYNMRLANGVPVFDGEQVQVGGNESYKPVCRCCYHKAKESVAGVTDSVSSAI